MGVVEPKENGDVLMTVWKTKSSICQKEVYKYEKTSVPGVFTYYSTRHSRVKDITVVETNYSEFAVIYKHRKFNREFSQVSLYSESISHVTITLTNTRVLPSSHISFTSPYTNTRLHTLMHVSIH
ncbi:hypothetical protein QTP86_025728 [Hemibagrus guttatus]|nr:hypothetical protein QTP86_025728 [Hemibagrus guttatus]